MKAYYAKTVVAATLLIVAGALPTSADAQIIMPTNTLTIQFAPSGTHVDSKGNLKIRLDFIPGPEDKSYAEQRVYVVDEASKEFLAGYKGKLNADNTPVNQVDYDIWWNNLPRIWRTNPALSAFITIPPSLSVSQLTNWLAATFTSDVTATIDDAASQVDSAHLLSSYMRDKSTMSEAKISAGTDGASLISTINARLGNYSLAGYGSGQVQPVQSGSITIGYEPGNLGDYQDITTTFVTKQGPASGTGTLDTWKMYLTQNGANVKVATFYVVSGNNLSTRDYESIGTVTSGSIQTFTGLSTDVATGDYAGIYGTAGRISDTVVGGSGARLYYRSGSNIPSTNTTFSQTTTNQLMALYATGTEAGWTNIQYVSGVDQSTINNVGTVLGTNIGTIAGVTP